MTTRTRKRRLEREGRIMHDAGTMEKVYRLATVAERADLAISTVEKHVREGFLKVVRVGPHKRPRVKESELRRYLGDVKDE